MNIDKAPPLHAAQPPPTPTPTLTDADGRDVSSVTGASGRAARNRAHLTHRSVGQTLDQHQLFLSITIHHQILVLTF